MSSKRVSDIKEREKPEPIEIRVVKRWIPSSKRQDPTSKRQELCYLFVDRHGDAIEAIADLNAEPYFDSIIKVQSCYIVTNYIAIESRKHMPIVPHDTSLKIGKRARFVPLSDTNIPTQYFNFATYEELESRTKPPKLLTDYIGRVEKNSQTTTRTGKMLRKINIKDDRENPLQITLWPEKADLIGDETVPGDIIAITSTTVTEYKGLKQLESTYATTIVINPTSPEIQHYVERLKALSPTKSVELPTNTMTIQELLANISTDNTPQQSHFRCFARIKEIYSYRKWYYVQCSICSKKLYPEQGDSIYFVCEDDVDAQPKYMYCVNASIIDSTTTTDVVFFNEAMTSTDTPILRYYQPKLFPR